MTASSGFSPLARSAAWLLLPALFLAGCSQSKPAEEPVRAVKLVTVGTSDFEAQPEFSAEVRARVESRLGFRVAGKI
ncbi:MAG TPA: efflux RND transporter periplasmic adaptor subunit, partial [Variovorax sp.]|nr:efflux RND transporter periplasmic adaptor subunit [Variovorax sp.]